ncbi:hypothetical protein D3C86_2014000 [compost metagenome]
MNQRTRAFGRCEIKRLAPPALPRVLNQRLREIVNGIVFFQGLDASVEVLQ